MSLSPLPQELTKLFNADRFTCSEMERMIREYGESCARMAREEESYIIDLLVAAGHVTELKVAEAREIAAAIRKG